MKIRNTFLISFLLSILQTASVFSSNVALDTSLMPGASGFALATADITPASDEVIGWQFSLTESVVVNELGWYTSNTPGTEVHQIGVWTADTMMLVGSGSVAVDAGSGPNQFLFESTIPFLLPVGSYVIAGTNSAGIMRSEFFASFLDDGNPPPETVNDYFNDPVFFEGSRSISSSTLAFPTTFDAGSDGLYGPNFSYSIPEPTVFSLLAVTFLGFSISRRRKTA